MTAELVIGAPGLGREINLARQGGAVDLMYALIIATGLLGWALNALFSAWGATGLHWHPSQRDGAGRVRPAALGGRRALRAARCSSAC